MSRPDAARERWKDTKRSALGRAEGHHTGLRLPGRLCCFYGTLRGEAEKPEEEMSPPPGAPVAEGQKKRISSGRAVAERLSRRRDPRRAVGRDPSALCCPLNRGWRRRRRAPLRRHPGPRVFRFPCSCGACALCQPSHPRPSPQRHPPRTAPDLGPGAALGDGRLLARCASGLCQRGGGPTESSFFVVEMSVVGGVYTLKDHVGSLSIPPRSVGGRRD